MEEETYSKEELQKDLYLMVKSGLLDIAIREDGEWLYKLTDAAKVMTDDEKMRLLENTYDSEEDEF
jgi:hypothetical protein